LILRVRDQLYDWRTGAAIILSELVFGKELESKIVDFQHKVDSYAQVATKDIEDFADPGFDNLIKNSKANKVKASLSENPGDAIYLKHLDNEHQFDDNVLSEGEVENDDADIPTINVIKDIEIPLHRRSAMTEVDQRTKSKKKKYKKTLFLTTKQLKNMGLKYGKNEITYTVDSGFQGTQTNISRIFFWNYKVKIVISDVDGTITKSDVLGHILPRLGRDWSHAGVTELFTNIRSNGYEMMYLTSRAIGMADMTRSYLHGLEQQETFKLPDGPCIMSPDRLMHSFKREVIDRKPQLFKIAALLNIK
jgi:phosphatidate phosphatase LPIN